jgi:hypothetical protein
MKTTLQSPYKFCLIMNTPTTFLDFLLSSFQNAKFFTWPYMATLAPRLPGPPLSPGPLHSLGSLVDDDPLPITLLKRLTCSMTFPLCVHLLNDSCVMRMGVGEGERVGEGVQLWRGGAEGIDRDTGVVMSATQENRLNWDHKIRARIWKNGPPKNWF